MASTHGTDTTTVAAAGHQTHHLPATIYYKTYGILMLLLIATVGMYYVDLQRWIPFVGTNLLVAMVIAVTKAALVILFFMNVKYSTKLTWLWAALGFIWLLLMAGVFMDYLTRGWADVPGWQ